MATSKKTGKRTPKPMAPIKRAIDKTRIEIEAEFPNTPSSTLEATETILEMCGMRMHGDSVFYNPQLTHRYRKMNGQQYKHGLIPVSTNLKITTVKPDKKDKDIWYMSLSNYRYIGSGYKVNDKHYALNNLPIKTWELEEFENRDMASSFFRTMLITYVTALSHDRRVMARALKRGIKKTGTNINKIVRKEMAVVGKRPAWLVVEDTISTAYSFNNRGDLLTMADSAYNTNGIVIKNGRRLEGLVEFIKLTAKANRDALVMLKRFKDIYDTTSVILDYSLLDKLDDALAKITKRRSVQSPNRDVDDFAQDVIVGAGYSSIVTEYLNDPEEVLERLEEEKREAELKKIEAKTPNKIVYEDEVDEVEEVEELPEEPEEEEEVEEKIALHLMGRDKPKSDVGYSNGIFGSFYCDAPKPKRKAHKPAKPKSERKVRKPKPKTKVYGSVPTQPAYAAPAQQTYAAPATAQPAYAAPTPTYGAPAQQTYVAPITEPVRPQFKPDGTTWIAYDVSPKVAGWVTKAFGAQPIQAPPLPTAPQQLAHLEQTITQELVGGYPIIYIRHKTDPTKFIPAIFLPTTVNAQQFLATHFAQYAPKQAQPSYGAPAYGTQTQTYGAPAPAYGTQTQTQARPQSHAAAIMEAAILSSGIDQAIRNQEVASSQGYSASNANAVSANGLRILDNYSNSVGSARTAHGAIAGSVDC